MDIKPLLDARISVHNAACNTEKKAWAAAWAATWTARTAEEIAEAARLTDEGEKATKAMKAAWVEVLSVQAALERETLLVMVAQYERE